MVKQHYQPFKNIYQTKFQFYHSPEPNSSSMESYQVLLNRLIEKPSMEAQRNLCPSDVKLIQKIDED